MTPGTLAPTRMLDVRIERLPEPVGKARLKITWSRNARWSEWTTLADGCYILRSNLCDVGPATLWKRYIQLSDAEWAFRIDKDELKVRPVEWKIVVAAIPHHDIGFLLGLSRTFHASFDPIVQFLRPISPLAWLPLGLVVFQRSEPAAIFTIALYGAAVLAWTNEWLIAMGGFKRLSNTDAELKRMRIVRDVQGHGYGTALLRELESRAWQAGVRNLSLEAAKRRPLTLEFYRKHGYLESGQGMYGAVETVRFTKTLG